MITQGKFGPIPRRAKWWGIECWDGTRWLRLEAPERENGKPVRWWPISTVPTPEHIGQTWKSGTYRMTWTEQDKRKRLTVSEPFMLVDPSSPEAAQMVQQLLGVGAGDLLDPETAMGLAPAMANAELRCTHCGRSDGETPLQTFMMMFPLMNLHLDRQAKLLELQHARAIEEVRSGRDLALEQTRHYFENLDRMRREENTRLARLEEKLADMLLDDDGELDMDNPTTAIIVQQLFSQLGPVIGAVASKYIGDKTTPTIPATGGTDE